MLQLDYVWHFSAAGPHAVRSAAGSDPESKRLFEMTTVQGLRVAIGCGLHHASDEVRRIVRNHAHVAALASTGGEIRKS